MIKTIKEIKIKDKLLSLVKFETIKGYEIQYSSKDNITETKGIYNKKSEAVEVFNDWKKELLEEN